MLFSRNYDFYKWIKSTLLSWFSAQSSKYIINIDMTYQSTVHFFLSTYMYICFSLTMTDRNGVMHVIFTKASWVWVAIVVRLAVIFLWAPVTDKKKNIEKRNTEWHIKTALHFGLLFRSSVLRDLHQHNSGLMSEPGIYHHGKDGKGFFYSMQMTSAQLADA